MAIHQCRTIHISILIGILLISGCQNKQHISSNKPFGLVIHGGAGTILKKNMSEELESEYIEKLKESLHAGYTVLENQGSSLDAIQAAITILEDSPLFNAGKGAVFTNAGTNELDAAIMDGKTLNAGAVAGVKRIKNPLYLARLVMEKSPHVLLTGEGAEAFAEENGIELISPDYFFTEQRWEQLQQLKEQQDKSVSDLMQQNINTESANHLFGTVGCVALDQEGNLAAGTSTGGLTNKRFGRVGDVPIIGAGTYANNQTCAVSATGEGEYFIRSVIAYDISALMDYRKMSLQNAADRVIMEKLTDLGGTGGIIAIDNNGHIAISFNTSGMYRGYIDMDGEMSIKIYKY